MYPADEVVQTPIGTALTRERRVSVTRVFAGGCAVAALVVLGGAAIEVVRLGTTDAAAAARVEQDVRAAFVEMTADVEGLARGVADDPQVSRAMASDAGTDEADRVLFDAAKDARERLPEDVDVLAVTIYDGNGVPRAWAGRASDLPADRTKGPASLFVTPSPLGLRLVRLQPIASASSSDPARARLRRGRARPHAGAPVLHPSHDERVRDADLTGRVSLRLHDARAPRPRRRKTFVIAAPDGTPLLDASVTLAHLAEDRARLRRTVAAAAIAVLAITVLLLAGPLLDGRAAVRSAPRESRLTLMILLVIVAGVGLLWLAFTISPWSSARVNRSAFRLLLGGIGSAACRPRSSPPRCACGWRCDRDGAGPTIRRLCSSRPS